MLGTTSKIQRRRIKDEAQDVHDERQAREMRLQVEGRRNGELEEVRNGSKFRKAFKSKSEKQNVIEDGGDMKAR